MLTSQLLSCLHTVASGNYHKFQQRSVFISLLIHWALNMWNCPILIMQLCLKWWKQLRSISEPEQKNWKNSYTDVQQLLCLFVSNSNIRLLRFSNISVIPALSASSSILNFDSSWSNLLVYRSTWKHIHIYTVMSHQMHVIADAACMDSYI